MTVVSSRRLAQRTAWMLRVDPASAFFRVNLLVKLNRFRSRFKVISTSRAKLDVQRYTP
jgi:hypothetical protein